MLAVVALGMAVVAETLIRRFELPGALHLTGIGMLYVAWWIALTGAISRVSGTPFRWFTILLPAIGGVLVLIGEIAIALDAPSIGDAPSSLGLLLVIAVPVVTAIAARKEGLRWKAGSVAWSLLLWQASISMAGLSGIPFGTFGEESRADEAVFYAIVPPLVALLVGAISAPELHRVARVAAGGLVLLAIPGVLFSTSDGGPGLLLAIFALGGLLVIVDAIGRPSRPSHS